jgi:hypothetical protein
VNVPSALLGHVEDIGAENLAVGGDNEGVVARDLVAFCVRPRPLRASGCEMTRPTSWSEAASPRRTVAAKSGVPAKTTFKARREEASSG